MLCWSGILSSIPAAQAGTMATVRVARVTKTAQCLMRNLRICGFTSSRDYKSYVPAAQPRRGTHLSARMPQRLQKKRNTTCVLACLHISIFVFEQYETVPCLFFLAGELAARGLQEMVVIAYRCHLVMERIVSGGPKEVRTGYFRKKL